MPPQVAMGARGQLRLNTSTMLSAMQELDSESTTYGSPKVRIILMKAISTQMMIKTVST